MEYNTKYKYLTHKKAYFEYGSNFATEGYGRFINWDNSSDHLTFFDLVWLFRFVPLPGTYVYAHPEEFRLVESVRTGTRDWNRFHIHHNDQHWWDDEHDFKILEKSFAKLKAFVDSQFNP